MGWKKRLKNMVHKRNNMNIDDQYLAIAKSILENGVDKGDRTGTGTKSIFSAQVVHDMSEGFPLLTTKKVFWKGIVSELLWFLRGETNIKWLVENNNNIWVGDAYKRYKIWADDLSKTHKYLPYTKEQFIEKIKTDDEFADKYGELGPIYGAQWRSWGGDKEWKSKQSKQSNTGPMLIPGIDQIKQAIHTLKTNPDSRRIIVSAWNVGELDNMTLPPCFVKGSLVKTFNGEYLPIEKIRKGDLVLTEDGSYNEVYELMETKVNDTKLVSFRYCGSPYPIKCTYNHPFLIKGKGYVEAGDIKNGDYVSLPIPQKEEDFIINYSLKQNQYSSKDYEEVVDDEREWYLMGYFLGDGWLNKKGETLLSINDNQFELINGKIGGVVPLAKLTNSGDNVKKYCFKQHKWSLIFSEFGSGAKHKKIPEFILNGKKELILKFIEGYEDADGCKTKDGYSITTISDNIALNMQILYAKVGLKCSLYYQNRPTKTIIEGREVNQNNTYSIQTTKNKNNSDKFIFDGDKLWLKVYDKEIMDMFDGTVYNLSVANNHTYTVNNIINHNCHWAFELYTEELSFEERHMIWHDEGKKANVSPYMESQLSDMLDRENVPKRRLSLKWHQRSVDLPLGLPFNIASYALLLEILAKEVNMVPGTLVGDLTNVHIYKNQIEGMMEQIERDPYEYDYPKLVIANNTTWGNGIDEMLGSVLISDFQVEGYESYPSIKMPLSN